MSNLETNMNLLGMFKHASRNLKYPSITFPYNNSKIKMYLTGKGYVAVKIDGEYQGRIDFNPLNNTHDFKLYFCDNNLRALIEKVYYEPEINLAIAGKKYGSCCFCGRELIEKASVYWGYGPICAENFGLPHDLPPSASQSYDDVEI